jgi:Xaa-Pro aminopeptidase
MDHAGRRTKLESRLRELRLDACLITHLANVRYLCGFTGSAGVLALAGGGSKARFFTDGRYTTQAGEQVRGAKVVVGKKPALLEAMAWL